MSAFTPPLPAIAGEETASLSMMRTVSSEGAAFAHPKPDLQTTHGAYIGNVERLEDHAERMSVTGSDIGEEIKKLQLEQKLSDSRRSSIRLAQFDEPVRSASQRSQNPPYSSYNNSIVDVNHAARFGGFSPAGYVTSPVGSITSGSWSQPSMQRQISNPTSQLNLRNTLPEPEIPVAVRSTESPMRPSFEALPAEVDPEAASQTSFAAELKAIAQDIHEQLEESEPLATHPPADPALEAAGKPLGSPFTPDLPDRPPSAASTNTYQQAEHLFGDFDGVHYAPSTRLPSDGVQFAPGTRFSSDGSGLEPPGARRASGILPQPVRDTWVQPPPDPNMVYYPAPVPMMLNLPQRISSRPAAAVTAKRRDQMLSMMAPQDKHAAPWLDKDANASSLSLGAESDGRTGVSQKELAGVKGLPPQLRATMFFDAQPKHHEVEVKADSAVVTLDSILEASASAPVGAFTNHPFAGQQGAKVYKRETVAPRRSTTSMNSPSDYDKRKSLISLAGNNPEKQERPSQELKKRRSSFTMLFGKRSHSTNELAGADAARSTQQSRLTMRSTSGGATINADIYHGDAAAEEEERASHFVGEEAPRRQSGLLQEDHGELDEDDERYHDAVADQEPEEEEDAFAPPTTLLAELQKRKAQQKSRNRTAATAFPNGMHSTLLELDAVEEMERRKKGKARIALAWEDPDLKAQIEAEQNDEEVPLGMLFQKQNGVMKRISRADMETNAALAEADWDRPLGLIEQRALEENEPLSSRRNRLKGVAPQVMTKRNTAFGGLGGQSQLSLPRASQLNLSTQLKSTDTPPEGTSPSAFSPNLEQEGDHKDDDDDDIPLAQRAHRIKTRNALSMAISEIEGEKKPGEDFAGGLLERFGTPDKPAEMNMGTQGAPKLSVTPDPENETLAQRRARIQAEKAAQRPPISRHTSAGSGDLLNGVRASTILPGQSPSPGVGDERRKSGLGVGGLRPSRSMADLLAAHPLTANNNSARKVSDDQFKDQLPAGSLLAKNEDRQKRNKHRISSINLLGTGQGGMEGPLVGQVDERKRRMSSGNFGGMLDQNGGLNQRRQSSGNFDRGLLGDQERRQSGMFLNQPGMTQQQQPHQQQQMPMNGMMSGYGMPAMSPMGMPTNGMMSYPTMPNMQPYANPMAQMSMYSMPQMQMMPQMPQMGMMGMPMGNMSTPNFAAMQHQPSMMQMQQPQMPPQQTYAAFAQQQMGVRGGAEDVAPFSPEQRDMVHRWRQGIS